MSVDLHLGDCFDILPTIASASVDAVIADPPYPHIKRDYGYWTTEEWWAMMMTVCAETRRILKPAGSAVFILQPNSEHVGQMRGWLWEFMAWVCREWNMVQDVWWWNTNSLPEAHSIQGNLLRTSTKSCVWAGPAGCYRNQDAVLWTESQENYRRRATARAGRVDGPSGQGYDKLRATTAATKRGGVTPFNVLPFASANNTRGGGYGHSAATPLPLADWWTRYICPPGGTVGDWFMGSGTMGIAAVQNGCSFVGIEKEDRPGFYPTAVERIEAARAQYQPALEGLEAR